MESAVSHESGHPGAADAARLLLAVCFVAVGAIGFAAHDFVLFQQPVPKTIPYRETLAVICGALSVVVGIGLLVPPVSRAAALWLTIYVSLWVLALQLPRVLANPGVEGNWLGVGEDLTLVAGSWAAYCAIARREDASLAAARAVFGVALIPIGLSHFVYLKSASDLIPAWMPWHDFWSIFTGVAHIIAGLAIALRIVPQLAVRLEAVMESLITLICWVSAIVTLPGSRQSWVNFFISSALSAAAWAVLGSYRGARSLSFGWGVRAVQGPPRVLPKMVSSVDRAGTGAS
jgi:uncharacterized membrane protein